MLLRQVWKETRSRDGRTTRYQLPLQASLDRFRERPRRSLSERAFSPDQMDGDAAEVAAQRSLMQRPRRRARRQAEHQADAETHLHEAANDGRVIGLDLTRLRLKDAEVFQ